MQRSTMLRRSRVAQEVREDAQLAVLEAMQEVLRTMVDDVVAAKVAAQDAAMRRRAKARTLTLNHGPMER
jgi:hypothetical protein